MRNEEEKNVPDEPRKGSTSVFLYILLLFSAALLLMGLSSLLHQRSNTEALGQLQNSVSVMQEVQNLQDKIIDLQESREGLEEQLEQAQDERRSVEEQLEAEQKRAKAMDSLYVIQTQYQNGQYEACQNSIEEFENSGLVKDLPAETFKEGVMSPLDCYHQIRDANAARIAE